MLCCIFMTLKPAKCKHCRKRLERVGQRIHDDCVGPWYAANREKLRAKAVRAEKRQDREKREAMKSIPELIAEAQYHFNEFIRLRDRHKGCFVCGRAFPVGQLGGDFDAGHVRSRGAAGHLRFNEDNCHGECKSCNSSTGAKPHQIEADAIRIKAESVSKQGGAEYVQLEAIKKWDGKLPTTQAGGVTPFIHVK